MAKTGFGRYRDLKKKHGLFKITQLLNRLKGILDFSWRYLEILLKNDLCCYRLKMQLI